MTNASSAASAAAPLLQATALTRRFGGLAAVNNVSVDLHIGEVHAVIGTNGAGKSTLINMLSGEIAASSGAITLSGTDITGWPQARRARAGIGRSYQRTTIFPKFTALENCRLAAQAAAQRPWMLWEAAASCPHSVETAWHALEAAGLHDSALLIAGTISHGQQRQLEIAMCLATSPKVLLLDEPLAGMGAEETDRMLSMLERLKTAHAILLVEHDMDAVFRVADRITVMVNGQVIATDVPDNIRNNNDVKVAYLGETHSA
ncbi:MAG: ABC transporter ATP-binding protein [Oxalobacteraceae bacterium]|nr:ABC transporter ATP-binding protein [Oxalobacteraceae bacterium]